MTNYSPLFRQRLRDNKTLAHQVANCRKLIGNGERKLDKVEQGNILFRMERGALLADLAQEYNMDPVDFMREYGIGPMRLCAVFGYGRRAPLPELAEKLGLTTETLDDYFAEFRNPHKQR